MDHPQLTDEEVETQRGQVRAGHKLENESGLAGCTALPRRCYSLLHPSFVSPLASAPPPHAKLSHRSPINSSQPL